MALYARIFYGKVAELLETDGDITQMFPPELVWVDVTNVEGIGEHWTATEDGGGGWVFIAPEPPYVDPRPEIIAELDQIDRASSRPLRILIITDPDVGHGTAERAELEALELRASDLRAQLEALPPAP